MKLISALRRLAGALTAFAALVAMLPAAENSVAARTGAARPRLVDLGADKCIPCKMMAPILAELAKEYAGQLDVVFIDVWKDHDAGKSYGIQLIPTQIFYDAAGRELFRHEGFFSKKDILAKWAKLGVKLAPPPAKAPAAPPKS